jgi:hypothetical protein
VCRADESARKVGVDDEIDTIGAIAAAGLRKWKKRGDADRSAEDAMVVKKDNISVRA